VGAAHTTEAVVKAAMPKRDAAQMVQRLGIEHRHFAHPAATVAGEGAAVLAAALQEAGWAATDLDRVILVNSHAGDHPIPATVNALLAALGVHDRVGGFDLNNACTGFLSGLDVGARLIQTGLERVAVVTVELLSRFISPATPRSYVVLADAAAACLLEAAPSGFGLESADFGNDGSRMHAVTLAHGGPGPLAPGGSANRGHDIQFGAPGADFERFALEGMLSSARTALSRANATLAEVDWFVLHQPNGALFDAFLGALHIDPARTVRVVDRIGSVGAASAAMGLDALRRQRNPQPGDRVLFVAVGAGASRGAILWRWH
jgi:3-oxoacyl-[acyl-carrier-protein] synthase-3